MKKLIALALILTQQYLVFGQEPKNTIALQCTTVIAVNGLNIREKPSKNSRIIDKIPFGEKIKYLSKYSFGIETIKDYPNVGNCLYKKKDTYIFIGNWVKVIYKEKIGFVLDAYLFYDKQADYVKSENNQEYALLYSYNACYANIYTPSKFIWYGLFKDKNGSFLLKKVNINYFSTIDKEFDRKNFGVSVGNDNGLLLIIGSKKPLKEGLRKCIDLNKMREDNNNEFDEKKLKDYGIEKETIKEQFGFHYQYRVNKGKKTQILSSVYGKEDYGFTHIEFIGDIDGDNEMDYILGTDAEQGYDILFLSSEKKAGNIVEPVAYFYNCYCC